MRTNATQQPSPVSATPSEQEQGPLVATPMATLDISHGASPSLAKLPTTKYNYNSF